MELKQPKPLPPPMANSPIIQLSLLFFLIIICSGMAGGLVQLIGQWLGFDYTTSTTTLLPSSSIEEKNFIRSSLAISQIMTFLVPALIFMWMLYHSKTWLQLRLSNTPTIKTMMLGGLLMVLLLPIVQWVYWFNHQLPLPEWAIQQESLINNIINSLLQVSVTYELVMNLIVIAVLPALGEEFVFRGVIQQKMAEQISAHGAIWLTAILFSAIHLQFQGFLPRMLLGAVLGYLFYWSKNLWVPIFAHFAFNASQLLIQYRWPSDLEVIEPPSFLITMGAVVLSFLIALQLSREAYLSVDRDEH